jgi:hypothetical protein
VLAREFETIFVHVPKTGGQSIEMVFLARFGLSWENRAPLLLRANPTPRAEPQRLAHLFACEYVQHGYVGADDFRRYFKFAVVRNPWARAVSEYKYSYSRRGVPFAAFIERAVGRREGVVEHRHLDPQRSFLVDDAGATLVDRVLRFERLAEDFAEVSRRIFGRVEDLPRRNVSTDRTDYRRFYDERTAGVIAAAYRDDIEAFGYAFDHG